MANHWSWQRNRPLAQCIAVLSVQLILLTSMPFGALAQEQALTVTDERHFPKTENGDKSEANVKFTLEPATEPQTTSSTPAPGIAKLANQTDQALGKEIILQNGQAAALFEKFAKLPLSDKTQSKVILPEVLRSKPASTEIEPLRQSSDDGRSQANATATGPLTVTRISHSGAVDDLKRLTISFSQPMIELSTVSQTNSIDTKQFASITPEPKGAWQWAGSQTLIFTPDGPGFPKATKYTVTVPASANSISGSKIDKSYRYDISLPAVKIAKFHPTETSLENQKPLLIALFNQNIDREKVLAKTHLLVGKRNIPIQIVSGAEYGNRLKQEYAATQLDERPKAKQSWFGTSSLAQLPHETDKNFVAFEPVESLPKNSTIKITFDKNMPSEEGPLTSEIAEERVFTTAPPLKLVTNEIKFATTTKEQANQGFEDNYVQRQTFKFNNPIDFEKFEPSMVSISPAVEEFEIITPRQRCKHGKYESTTDDAISIHGHFKPYTRYTVAFSEKIVDKFGQPLGKKQTAILQTSGLVQAISPYHSFITLDPNKPLVHSIWGQGAEKLKVEIRKVAAEDWSKFNREHRTTAGTVGSLLATKEFNLRTLGKKIDIDLKPYIDGKYGHLFLTASLIGPTQKQTRMNYWIQVSDLSLDAYFRGKLHVLASNLSDGKPVEGVELTLSGNPQMIKSDSAGLAVLPLGQSNQIDKTLIGRKGADSSLITIINFNREETALAPKLKWYAASDRQLYKPGEKVFVKGLLREKKFPDSGATDLSFPSRKNVFYILHQGDNKEILKGRCAVDSEGSFTINFNLPEAMELGSAYLHIFSKLKENESAIEIGESLRLEIQEFRRPEFESTIVSSKGNSIFLGDQTILTSKNNYFSGGALVNAANRWQVTAQEASFKPTGWNEFDFDYEESNRERIYQLSNPPVTESLTVQTDKDGRGAIKLKSEQGKKPSPVMYKCESTVTDINRQNWTSSFTLTGHPADIYVGLKGERELKPGESYISEVVATDLKGKILPGTKVELRMEETLSDKEQIVSLRTINIGEKPASFSHKTKANCTKLFITASIKDSKGRLNHCSLFAMFFPKTWTIQDWSTPSRKTIIVNTDKQSYQVGETAQITLKSAIFPAHGFLLFAKDMTFTTMPLTIDGPEKTIEVPITENHYPNVYVHAYLAKDKNSYATGQCEFRVPPVKNILTLKVEPNKVISEAGKEITLNIDLKSNEKPVSNGQVAIAVVDESVLALAKYKWENPIEKFYDETGGHIDGVHTRTQEPGYHMTVYNSRIIAGRIGESGGPPPVVTGTIEFEEAKTTKPFFTLSDSQPVIGFRKDLAALAFFKPVVVTNSEGKAQVKFKLPDSVTRYRIMAIAAAGTDKFGSCESSLTTQMALMLKPSPPRFLNFGDNCELPVVVQNLTDKPLKTAIALRSNIAEIIEPGKLVDVPAHDRVEVRFAIKAISNGIATFQCIAKTDNISDTSEFSVPILTPASRESVATYGVIDNGAIMQKLAAPKNVIESIGGLSIETASSALQSLGASFDYLRNYQFNCTEQISSRLIAMVSMQEAKFAFNELKPAEVAAYKKCIEDDIALLEKRQNYTGNFGLWAANEQEKWPYVTIQATQALLLAKNKGYSVSERILLNALSHLKEIDQDIPSSYEKNAVLAIRAKALNVRHQGLHNDIEAAKDLLHKAAGTNYDKLPIDKMKAAIPVEIAAWLLPVLSKDQSLTKEVTFLRNYINSKISETASTASVEDKDYNDYGDYNYALFYSPRRAEATVAAALIEDQPDNPLIPKLVKGLLAGRRNGVWQGTQENSQILQVLAKYFSVYEKQTPNLKAQAWLNDTLIANNEFVGRSSASKSIKLPMDYLLSNSKASNEITINKEGDGRLYYRVALDYASKELNLKAIDQGFTVSRNYEPIGDNSAVRKDDSGVWHFKAGSTVRAKVRFKAPAARYHVVLCDPLAAGCEAINKNLAGTQSHYDDYSLKISNSDERYQPTENWCEHENLRDQQAEAFTSLMNGGDYTYSYLLRATTPGHFTVPPTKVEEMYTPETFGRTASDYVIIY